MTMLRDGVRSRPRFRARPPFMPQNQALSGAQRDLRRVRLLLHSPAKGE
jgi:hypothetical protein